MLPNGYKGAIMDMKETYAESAIYNAILTSMGEGIIFADHTNRIIFVNSAAEEIRGIKAENFLGRDLLSIHSPPAREQINSILTSLRDGIIPSHTRPLEMKGQIFTNTKYPIGDDSGRFVGTVMVSRDIKEYI